MEIFLRDVFDSDSDSFPGRFFEPYPGKLKLGRVLESPELASNLAFHEAWRAAFGVRATRVDAEHFARKGGRLEVLSDAISEISAVRLLEASSPGAGQKLLARANEAFQRAKASFAANPAISVKLALRAKLSDRFGGRDASSAAKNLVAEYADAVVNDPLLEPLERWAAVGESDVVYRKPRHVAEYYGRVAIAAAKLRLPWTDPLTGMRIIDSSAKSRGDIELSCAELIRIPLARDRFLWRRDLGGALFHVDPWDDPPRLTATRVARIPRALLAHALPDLAGLPFARAFLSSSSSSDAAYSYVVPVVDAVPAFEVPALAVRPCVVRSETPEGVDLSASRFWLPASGLCFGATVCAPKWAEPIRSSMLSAMTRFGLPDPQAPTGAAGVVLFHQLVARHVARRGLGSRVFITASPGQGGRVGEIVLVDDRPNVWSALSVLCTLDALARPGEWSVSVLCGSERARKFFERVLLPQVPHATVSRLDEEEAAEDEEESPFDIEAYNATLKSAKFWRRIRAPMALLVQDDGLLFRREGQTTTLDDDAELMAQHYVGSPWLDHPDNRQMLEGAGVGPGLVGNGGLSLRRVQTMLEICEGEDVDQKNALFNWDLQPVPEDVFFSAAIQRRRLACPRELASRFSMEQQPIAGAFGMHKPWPYVPRGFFLGEIRAILGM